MWNRFCHLFLEKVIKVLTPSRVIWIRFGRGRHLKIRFQKIKLQVCLSQGFYSCTNIMTKKQVGEERVYSAYISTLLFITKEVRTGIQVGQEQELMQRPWRDVHYWLASPGSLSLLSYRTQDYQPRDGPTHKGPFPS